MLDNWIAQEKTGKPGATVTYTNQAIVTMVSLKSVFGLPGRALCGFVESVFKLMNIELSVPDTRIDIETTATAGSNAASEADERQAACSR